MGQLRCNALNTAGYAVLVLTLVSPLGGANVSGVKVELGAGFGEFSVSNQGPAISLNSIVVVERKENEKWVRASVTSLHLREVCGATKLPRCREVKPNEKINAVPWTGKFCSSQCPSHCRLDGPAPPGSYRFVVTRCDGRETFSSPEFEKKQ
jgi:hypothetical protein